MVKRYQDGEVIDLVWPDMQDPDEVYVRGWMDYNKAQTLLKEHYPDYRIGIVNEAYGRWSMESDEDGEHVHTMRTYNEPGRGRFKIMVAACYPKPAWVAVTPPKGPDPWWKRLFTRR